MRGDHIRAKSVQVKLSIDITVVHIVWDGRAKNFPVSYLTNDETPVILNRNFNCLVTMHFHKKFH